ncbi:NAD(P)-dependent dehydrogenase, short-chain alcohol dehydrogenase family [Chryseolinea serpens]|uniref:NAD(P)-dependent dehydrogenase, short-chain alcohol dehydrogenase family n=1 Tax=Chryseolinea serpens TaxID=947013 RepID=A0A1M5TE12_9BACT|nr:SDR family NAD(P)-dependent oxidoreductase [Chryseolinea serpens]SHH48553.1 NAD(P)-dependent dehydrogenase, short-chain alcohol dehydrogenase family [Chryseolinea serpens]
MDISQTSAIVTGGASGLGAATARALASAGAKVAVLDMNVPQSRQVAEEIGGLAIECDVTDEEGASKAFEIIRAKHGVARVLVNCAGIGTSGRIVGKKGPMPLADFSKVININLIGSFNMMRLAAAEMIPTEPLQDGERGVIISTVSAAAYEGQIGQAAYAASKGGIVSLTLPAAREFAQFGIRVNAIAPGLFLTPLMNELSEEAKQNLGAAIPFPKRLGGADEFAKLVLHIISNRYINGEVIRIDGALRMQAK